MMQRGFSGLSGRRWYVMGGMVLLSVGMGGCGGGVSHVAGPVRSGMWGGTQNNTPGATFPATLQVTVSGGQLTLVCGETASLNQPLILDSNGHFSATGTITPLNGIPITGKPTAQFAGTVNGNVMTLTLTDAVTGDSLGTYTLTFGQPAPSVAMGCPN
jgi:hypothetical protein